MSERYAFAVDLDGTALNAQGLLSDYTKEAFKWLIDEGHEIIVASGRALESLPEEIIRFDGIRYAITSNGAAIHDIREQKVLKKYTLEKDTVGRILRVTEHDPVVYETFIDGRGYGEADYVNHPKRYGVKSEHGVRYIKATRTPVEGMIPFLMDHMEELDCIDLIIDDQEKKQIIWKKLREQVKGILVTSSVPRMIEIADEKAGKGKALQWLLEKLQIDLAHTIAFGNAENDIDMMNVCHIGYAVSNADSECLIAADRITASNDDDGVAKAMIELMSDRKE